MFTLIQSNAQEKLLQQLFDDIEATKSTPFEKTILLTQNAALFRWIKLEKVKRDGICANWDFIFPSSFILQQYTHLNEAIHRNTNDPFQFNYLKDVTQLQFAIFDCLQNDANIQAFPEIQQLKTEEQRFAWAHEMADVYNQYLLYRPQWIFAFEQNQACECKDELQSALWQSIQNKYHFLHRSTLHSQFKAQFSTKHIQALKLPPVLFIFGINALAPMQLEFFMLLAEHGIKIHFYWLNPSQEFWQDLKPHKKVPSSINDEDEYFTYGHFLLTALCQQRQQFSRLLNHYDINEHALFIDPPKYAKQKVRLLNILQMDILHANAPEQSVFADHKFDALIDDSLLFIEAPSKRREIEHLYEHLLNEFSKNPDLEPCEIVVMSPNLAEYESIILSVFSDQNGQPKIPFNLNRISYNTPIEDALIRLLELPLERITNQALFEFLSLEPIKAVVFPELSLQEIQQLFLHSGFIWGESDQSYQALDLPTTSQYTWQKALERMLMSLFSNTFVLNDTLPLNFTNISFSNDGREVFTTCLPYFQALFQFIALKDQEKSLYEWAETLVTFLALEQDIDTNSQGTTSVFSGLIQIESEQAFSLYSLIAQLKDLANTLPHDFKINYACLSNYLTTQLQAKTNHTRGFLTGGITFCSTLPMRAIPFQYVIMIGLKDGDFPKTSKDNALNHLLHFPKTGDHSARHDDRELFMDALLSARHQLYLSYSKDFSPKPMLSNLIGEFISILKSYYFLDFNPENKEINLITSLPLFAFDPSWVQNNGSYNPYIIEALLSNPSYLDDSDQTSTISSATKTPLTEIQPLTQEQGLISINDLITFWKHPINQYIKERHACSLDEYVSDFRENEPFILDKTSTKKALSSLFSFSQYQNIDPYHYFSASQILPDQPLFDHYANGLQTLHTQLLALTKITDYTYMSQSFTLTAEDYQALHKPINDFLCQLDLCYVFSHLENNKLITLWGQVSQNQQQEYIEIIFNKPYASDLLAFYIKHLLHCSQATNSSASKLYFIDKTDEASKTQTHLKEEAQKYHLEQPSSLFDFSIDYLQLKKVTPECALHQLSHLLYLMQLGKQIPLPFFNRTSFAYAEMLIKAHPSEETDERIFDPSTLEKAQHQALKEWENTYNNKITAEAEEYAHHYLFKGFNVLEEEAFHQLAMKIWEPYFHCLQEND